LCKSPGGTWPDVKINTSGCKTAPSLLDDTGLDGPTMRRVADKLGVQPGALYWHVKSKRAADAMAGDLADAAAGLEVPRQHELAGLAPTGAAAAPRHAALPDGAKVSPAPSQEPAVFSATTGCARSRTVVVRPAARSVATAALHRRLHREEQHTAAKAAGGGSTSPSTSIAPLTAQVYAHDTPFDPDTDESARLRAGEHVTRMQATHRQSNTELADPQPPQRAHDRSASCSRGVKRIWFGPQIDRTWPARMATPPCKVEEITQPSPTGRLRMPALVGRGSVHRRSG
jgi:TetR/AcrR family tetracycline transcriptional repressor